MIIVSHIPELYGGPLLTTTTTKYSTTCWSANSDLTQKVRCQFPLSERQTYSILYGA